MLFLLTDLGTFDDLGLGGVGGNIGGVVGGNGGFVGNGDAAFVGMNHIAIELNPLMSRDSSVLFKMIRPFTELKIKKG